MKSLIRFLALDARRPTYVYEGTVYGLARLILALAGFVLSALAAPHPAVLPWLLLSALVSFDGARAAQTARSGAARKDEVRARVKRHDVVLPCEPDLRRAANVSSFCATLAPLVALGSALSAGAAGASFGVALAASLLGVAQAGFDALWSLALYPAWRRAYTRERDRLRGVADIVSSSRRGSGAIVVLCKGCGGAGLDSAKKQQDIAFAERVECTFCRRVLKARYGHVDGEFPASVACVNLDDLIERMRHVITPGTTLKVGTSGPEVVSGFVTWRVIWNDGTSASAKVLREEAGRERFKAEWQAAAASLRSDLRHEAVDVGWRKATPQENERAVVYADRLQHRRDPDGTR